MKKNTIFLLHAYALCTVFFSCSSVQSRIGTLNADIKKRTILCDDIIMDVLQNCPAEDLKKMRKVSRQWKRLASPLLAKKKKSAKIFIPGIDQFFMIENMLKRIQTLKLKYLIVERWNPGCGPSERPTLDDFLPLPENYAPGQTSLAELEFLNVKLNGNQNQNRLRGPLGPWHERLRYKNVTSRLDLRNNHIGDEGAEKFSMMHLPENIKLLDMSGNNIGAYGAIALSKMNLPSLVFLNLNQNNLQPAGIIALSNMNLPKINGFHVVGHGLEDADVIKSRENARLNAKDFFYIKSRCHNEFCAENAWGGGIDRVESEEEKESIIVEFKRIYKE